MLSMHLLAKRCPGGLASRIFYRTANQRIVLRVRVKPGSKLDSLRGIKEFPDGERLVVVVRAVPDKGKANAAVCQLLARELGLAKTRLAVVSGSTSRLKTIAVTVENSGESELIMGRLKDIRAESKGEF